MPEAADAVDGDEIAGAGPGVAQSVEGGDAGAEQRRRFDRDRDRPAHARPRTHGRSYAWRSRRRGSPRSGRLHVLAGESGVAPAAAAIAARAAEPADAGARADAPALDALADRVDDADHLVAGNARVLDARQQGLGPSPHRCGRRRRPGRECAFPHGPATGMSRSSASSGPPRFRTTIARIFAIA